ncbi:MAG: hypothetical protein EBT39_04580, partial [Sphingobacteriia bacterium]|nr:hypothetical protein [Candidatus Fonsibacter lacus]
IRLDEGDEIAATSKIEEQDVPELEIVEGAEASAEATDDANTASDNIVSPDVENNVDDSPEN